MVNEASYLVENRNATQARQSHSKRKLRFTLLTAIAVAGIALADSIGIYECDGCSPSDPLDIDTQAFIASEVNQDLDAWWAGDHVLIYDEDTGEAGVWGRISAVGPRQYMGSPGQWGYIPVGGGGGTWTWQEPCGFLEVCFGIDPY